MQIIQYWLEILLWSSVFLMLQLLGIIIGIRSGWLVKGLQKLIFLSKQKID